MNSNYCLNCGENFKENLFCLNCDMLKPESNVKSQQCEHETDNEHQTDENHTDEHQLESNEDHSTHSFLMEYENENIEASFDQNLDVSVNKIHAVYDDLNVNTMKEQILNLEEEKSILEASVQNCESYKLEIELLKLKLADCEKQNRETEENAKIMKEKMFELQSKNKYLSDKLSQQKDQIINVLKSKHKKDIQMLNDNIQKLNSKIYDLETEVTVLKNL